MSGVGCLGSAVAGLSGWTADMKLWLDDVRPAPEGWVWARTNEDAKRHLLTGEVEECSLDHDLGYHDLEIPDPKSDPDAYMDVLTARGQTEETGYQLVNWMIENECVPAKVAIHSWNPDGAKAMAARLNHHGYSCVVAPYVVST